MYAPTERDPALSFSGLFSEECREGSGIAVMGMDVDLLGEVAGTSGAKGVPSGPINILVRSVHFRM